jgi:membrane associated rhomboid family serine protease
MTGYYYRNSSNPIVNFWHRSTVNKIVTINILVFILQFIFIRSSFTDYLILHPSSVVSRGYIWQLITYMFLHGDLFHIAFNLLVIWMLGTTLEGVWGSNRFLKYYLVCGLGGAAFSFVFAYNKGVLGASAAVYGILLAYAVLFPYNELYIWGLFPIQARTLVIFLAGIEFLSGILWRGDGIAHFAHIGGMAAGLIYMRTDHRAWRLRDTLKKLWSKFPLRITLDKNESGGDSEYDSKKIDSILDKISSKGYENLTETERRILENYSKNSKKH